MATPRLLIDTSIIIEHLRKQNRQKSILYNIVNNYDLYTCPERVDVPGPPGQNTPHR